MNETPVPKLDAGYVFPSLWSIGIYAGDSPFTLRPGPHVQNPVLTYQDVTDIVAAFVADPFMVPGSEGWYMFFEVFNHQTFRGEIGLATSKDGWVWEYQQIVLKESFHLSYPYVFAWQGEYYMVPETLDLKAIQLYRAETFPTKWSPVGKLVERECADPSIFRFEDRWWMFACSTPQEHDSLRLYFADELMGPWIEHPCSPIVEGNNRIARPAGRVLVLDDKVIRHAQNCFPIYGTEVRAFEISELTPSTYQESECALSPIMGPNGTGWNAIGMHHVDPHQLSDGRWIACVDGLCLNDSHD
ncbi:MAG: hypothetical protein ND895_08245 [Pyrinomonadaceae bacterium]|nr:hypothetical protein [Pyrinomonadaceae bacterium]